MPSATITQRPINNSYRRIPQCAVISATERNLKANANSAKPRITFTLFIHPPDFGSEFNHDGNAAKRPNGTARANENPNITTSGAINPFDDASTNALPIKGPVQEKETMASVAAIKKIPIKPPLSAMASLLLLQLLGNVIS